MINASVTDHVAPARLYSSEFCARLKAPVPEYVAVPALRRAVLVRVKGDEPVNETEWVMMTLACRSMLASWFELMLPPCRNKI